MTEMIVGFIICTLLAIGFIVIGVLIMKGNLSLLAGYNTMSKREREKYDRVALGRFVGIIIFVIAVCLIIMGVNSFLQISDLTYLAIFTIVALAIFAVIFANTSKRFKK